jgi:helix-turn-helix protein
MQNINPDLVAHIVIPHFLRILMKRERENIGLAQKQASKEAGWSAPAWGEVERARRILKPHNWITVCEVLGLNSSEVVQRLNAFIVKNNGIWLERRSGGEIAVCERQITSPRAMRSGNIVNTDLNRLRPSLFLELSAFFASPEKVIEEATKLGFFASRKMTPPPRDTGEHTAIANRAAARREHAIQQLKNMSDEKFGLLERVLDKFNRYNAKQLAHAYQHFSLAVSKH